jgi:hypothetical protein
MPTWHYRCGPELLAEAAEAAEARGEPLCSNPEAQVRLP